MEENAKFHNRNPSSIMTDEDARDVLLTAQVGFLSLAFESWPYCVPVNFVYANGEIYIHSAKVGKKIAMIEANPPVCLAVLGEHRYIPGECYYVFESVLVYGKAWRLDDREQKRRAYQILLAKYEPEGRYDLEKDCIDESAIIVIEVDEITGKRKGEIG